MIIEISTEINNHLDSVAGFRLIKHWRISYPCLTKVHVCDFAKPLFGRCDADDIQRAMIQLAQAGDSHAPKVLVSQLAPGLVRLANIGYVDGDQEALSAFFEVVMGRDTVRRPNKVAANLLLDTRQILFRRYQKSANEVLVDDPQLLTDRQPVPESNTAVDESIDYLRNWLEPDTPATRDLMQMAKEHWLHHKPLSELAERYRLSETATSTRLWRLAKALRTDEIYRELTAS